MNFFCVSLLLVLLLLIKLIGSTINIESKYKFSTKLNSFLNSRNKYAKNANECGITRTRSAQRIIGGRKAIDGEFPWQISLHRNGIFRCGGSIINQRTVLTAAHCVNGFTKDSLTVRYNSLIYSSGTQLAVSKVIVHLNYDTNTVENDIAILRVSPKMILGQKNARSVCLPSQSEDSRADSLATVTGWGRTSSEFNSKFLMATDVPIVDRRVCQQRYRNFPPSFKVTENMICAGFSEGGKDSCNGDSGGAMVSHRNGRYIMVGIVSKGFGCALAQHSGIYTRVANYVNWIKRNSD